MSVLRNILLALTVSLIFTGFQSVSAHDLPSEMASIANRMLKSVSAEEKQKLQFRLKDDERENWHFFPNFAIKPDGRQGFFLEEMSTQQQLYSLSLLNSALSHRGQLEASTVMTLEKVLQDLDDDPRRNPEHYSLCIFGTPSAAGTWGWRFEGHHLSINVTLVDGKMASATPSFFGANPAVVPGGPFTGEQLLAAEENLAFQWLQSLDATQQKSAMISTKPPKEILSAQERVADRKLFSPPQGLSFGQMNENQRKLVVKLIHQYVKRHRQELLDLIPNLESFLKAQDVYVAWGGATKPEEPHYYRIQSNKFLIEYANTQNDTNHVHAVWRDFDGDFGRDLLKEHFENHHR